MSRSEASSLCAVLYSGFPPSKAQEERFSAWLSQKYGRSVSLTWEPDPTAAHGFRLQVGSEVYDWSPEGRLQQLKESLEQFPLSPDSVVPLLRETVAAWDPDIRPSERGTVLCVSDGIAIVNGLDRVAYGEILLFDSGIKGMVQNLTHDTVGCILFGDADSVKAGSIAQRTGKAAGIPVGDAFIGRVVDALGAPIDGKGEICAVGYLPLEAAAPSIIDRQPVNQPLETGIIAIDSMFPIGRGQRELIIGDRQTGKTAIALDTILNQKGKDVICIYVAIGQKASSIAQLVEVLRKHGSLEYSIIVNASASDPVSLQYIAPYAGCALGEYFMAQGRDVLIVYDDLSKHAVAYRALSLLLERSPGREAYPGDVFYLHSRLLERAAHLSDQKGGGSMTALPIVETQAGDVSAYIPTNIISITDGQIFLESDLFHAGQRPAVNVGLSVSRVGGDAQTKAMKSAASTIRLDLAQYREMAMFTQFSSDLDDVTRRQLAYGQSLTQMLRQPRYHPLKQHEQVILLVTALGHILQKISPSEAGRFCEGLLAYLEEHAAELCTAIDRNGVLSAEHKKRILALANEYMEIHCAKAPEQRR